MMVVTRMKSEISYQGRQCQEIFLGSKSFDRFQGCKILILLTAIALNHCRRTQLENANSIM